MEAPAGAPPPAAAESGDPPSAETHPQQWAVFTAIDKNGDGELTPSEFYDALEYHGYAPLAAKFMCAMDGNKDGTVDFEEFCKGYDNFMASTRGVVQGAAPPPPAWAGAKLTPQELFARLDKNGDGEVTPSEFYAALEQYGMHTLAAKFMGMLDANKDGTVDVEEFVNGFDKFEKATGGKLSSSGGSAAAPPNSMQDMHLATGNPNAATMTTGLAGWTTAKIEECIVVKIKERFKTMREAFLKFDADQGGSITVDELQDFATRVLNLPINADQAHQLMMKYDTNKNGSFDFVEFCDLNNELAF